MKTIFSILGVLWMIAILIGIGLLIGQRSSPMGSVGVTSEYNSTTTIPASPSWILLKKGQGTLGTINMVAPLYTGVTLTIYDATSTNSTLRVPQATSSQIILAAFQGGYATSSTSWIFDTIFTKGLLIVTNWNRHNHIYV